jgi:hypothetical protein
MSTNQITGKVVNIVRFDIDKKSWDNLDRFQKRLKDVKAQMSGMNASAKFTASMKTFGDTVAKTSKKIENSKAALFHGPDRKMWTEHKRESAKIHSEALAENKRRSRQLETERNRAHTEALRENFRREKERHKAGIAAGMVVGSQMSGLKAAAEARRADVTKRWNARGVARDRRTEHADVTSKRYAQRATASGIPAKFADEAADTMSRLRQQYIANRMSLKAYNSEMATANNRMRMQARQAANASYSMRDMRSELIQATAAFTAFAAVRNIANTGMKYEGLTAAARVFAKDDTGVAEHMSFIANEADRLGVNLMTATEEFTKFSIGTKNRMDKGTQRQLFSGVSEYATVLQLDKQQYMRFFKSINQMSEKGLYA